MLPASSVHLAGGGGTTEINHGVPGGDPQGVEGEGQDCVAPRTHVTKAANQDHADRMCSCHWPSASCLWLLTPAKGGMWVRKTCRKPGLTPSRRRPAPLQGRQLRGQGQVPATPCIGQIPLRSQEHHTRACAQERGDTALWTRLATHPELPSVWPSVQRAGQQ